MPPPKSLKHYRHSALADGFSASWETTYLAAEVHTGSKTLTVLYWKHAVTKISHLVFLAPSHPPHARSPSEHDTYHFGHQRNNRNEHFGIRFLPHLRDEEASNTHHKNQEAAKSTNNSAEYFNQWGNHNLGSLLLDGGHGCSHCESRWITPSSSPLPEQPGESLWGPAPSAQLHEMERYFQPICWNTRALFARKQYWSLLAVCLRCSPADFRSIQKRGLETILRKLKDGHPTFI